MKLGTICSPSRCTLNLQLNLVCTQNIQAYKDFQDSEKRMPHDNNDVIELARPISGMSEACKAESLVSTGATLGGDLNYGKNE